MDLSWNTLSCVQNVFSNLKLKKLSIVKNTALIEASGIDLRILRAEDLKKSIRRRLIENKFELDQHGIFLTIVRVFYVCRA